MKKGIISKLFVALLVLGLLFSILPSQQALAQDVTPTKVTPTNLNGWNFTRDSANSAGGLYSIVPGPDPTPLGFGSLKIETPLQGSKSGMVKTGFSGIKLTEIDHLVYSTYKVAGSNSSMNITVQFPVTGINGTRLVYEPYWNTPPGVINNQWQTWDALQGKWWITSLKDGTECNMDNPCLWSRVLEKWPNASMGGSLYVLAGTYATGLVAYADNLQISYRGNDYIYDFDPDPIIIYVDDDFTSATAGFGVTHFAKIQDGINAVMEGSTVNVAAGNYNEDLTINKSFTLQGAGRETTIVNGVGALNQNGMVNIIASDVSISGFTFNGVSSKTIQFTEATSNVSFTDNKVVGAENTTDANNFTLLENNYNSVQTGHVISGNIFVANNTSQLVYFNPTNSDITFTNNTFTGSSKTGGVGLVFEAPWGEKTVTGNDFSAITGSPFALLSAPESTPEEMGSLLAANTFPGDYVVLGTDIRLAKPVVNQTQGLDYDTIQAAINAANAGDLITVAEGTYNEALTVNKPLSLVGAGAAGTIIDGTGLTQSTLFHASGFSAGALEISGFTFKDDPDATKPMTYLVSFSGISAPATIDFHDNTLIGTGVTNKDWGLLAQGLDCAIVINNNTFDNIAGNSIMLERALGAVEIGNNTFKVPNGNGPAIWAMSYGTEADPHDVSGKQWYHDNHISPKTEGGNIYSGITIAPAWGNGWNVRQYGSFEDVLIEDNIVEGFISVGIQVEVDGMNSSLAKGIIQHNSLTAFPGELNSKGIRLLGNVTNTQLIGNNISAGYRGIWLSGTWGQPVYPTGISVELNNLADNVIGYDEIDTASNQDISPNWWGAATGPVAGYVVGNTNYIPYCTNPECTTFYGPVHNTTKGTFYATIQDAIDDANDNAIDTITVAAGTYAEIVDVTKAVTLLGPNAGVKGDGTRVAEAVIQGPSDSWVSLYVEPDVPGLMIDGFTFDGTNLVAAAGSYTVGVFGESSNVTLQNNVFVNHNDMAIMTSGVYFNGSSWKYDKWLTDVLIKDNLITNDTPSSNTYNFGIYYQSSLGTVTGNVVTNMRSGIQVQPYKTAGGGEVSGNRFEAYRAGIYFNYIETATADWKFENNSVEGIAHPTGLTPDRFNAIRVETMYQGAVDFKNNSILLGTSDATDKYLYFENNVTGGTRNATHNWWGTPCGPSTFVGDAALSPWWADAAMTLEGTAVPAGDFTVTPAMGVPSINASIACAQPNTTITFEEGEYTDTIIVPDGREHLTLKLNDGVKLMPNSPCIDVNASYTEILADSPRGAICTPSDGSNGIDVAADLVNIVVARLEIDGTDSTTGDGIHFAGPLVDTVLVDNYIHNMGGDGIEFAGDVTGVTDVQGNMFKNNVGLGVNYGGTTQFGVEFNSWGAYGGPAAGDGVNGAVISTPFTHADLYLVSSGTPWANQVVKGNEITYTVMAHLNQVNAAEFVLTYPEELTYVSSAPSKSLGSGDSVLHDATNRTLTFLGVSMTGNKSGDVPLFTVTFTGETAGVDKDLTFSYKATSGFGMAGYESSSNVYVNEMVDSTVTIVDLPTITSVDIEGYYLTGEPKEFSVVVNNPTSGADYEHVYVDFEIANARVEEIELIRYTLEGYPWITIGAPGSGTFMENDLNGNIIGYFGKVGGLGFPLEAGQSKETTFEVTFKTRDQDPTDYPTSYVMTMQLRDYDSVPTGLQLDDFSDTMYVYDKPTVTVGTTDQYLIVGEPGAFTVKINNPTTGRNYDDTVVFDILIPDHEVADFSELSCSISSPVEFTWDLLPLLVSDGAGGVKARIVGLDGYFEVPPTGVDMVLTCSVKVTEAGDYSASGNMVDVYDKVTPAERIVSDSVSLSTIAYTKPSMTAEFPTGPYAAGVPVTVKVTIPNSEGIPQPFELVFVLPAGTVISYGGNNYTCTTTCPPIPVTLPLGEAEFVITFDEAWTGTVGLSLYDSDWTPADRELVTVSQTGVVVNGEFTLTGTVSMQGRNTRAGVPVTLTWGGTLLPYGPTFTSTNAISNNLQGVLSYGGVFTVTTNQPRYLNIVAADGKTITVSGNHTLATLRLLAGNAVWTDNNKIDHLDAGLIGTDWGLTFASTFMGDCGDVNFDGTVSINDLALVGGNMDLGVEESAYVSWTP